DPEVPVGALAQARIEAAGAFEEAPLDEDGAWGADDVADGQQLLESRDQGLPPLDADRPERLVSELAGGVACARDGAGKRRKLAFELRRLPDVGGIEKGDIPA